MPAIELADEVLMVELTDAAIVVPTASTMLDAMTAPRVTDNAVLASPSPVPSGVVDGGAYTGGVVDGVNADALDRRTEATGGSGGGVVVGAVVAF